MGWLVGSRSNVLGRVHDVVSIHSFIRLVVPGLIIPFLDRLSRRNGGIISSIRHR